MIAGYDHQYTIRRFCTTTWYTFIFIFGKAPQTSANEHVLFPLPLPAALSSESTGAIIPTLSITCQTLILFRHNSLGPLDFRNVLRRQGNLCLFPRTGFTSMAPCKHETQGSCLVVVTAPVVY